MTLIPEDFMMDVTLSFHKVIDHYRSRLKNENDPIARQFIISILDFVKDHPELETGIPLEEFDMHREHIKTLLADLFPNALTLNEIKAATIPFSDFLFNKTQRFHNILEAASDDKVFSFLSGADFDYFKMACGVILNQCYGYSVDLSRPMQCEIPDQHGNIRTYRVTYNADFLEVALKDKKNKLNQSCIEHLLREPDHIELWREKFPPNSYSFRGFGIVSLTDITIDTAISDLKTLLLGSVEDKVATNESIEMIFKKMFNIQDLQAGFTVYNHEDRLFETMIYGDSSSFLLGDSHEKQCDNALCKDSYQHLMQDFTPLVIPDVPHYLKTVENDFLPKNLMSASINSAVFYPIEHQGELLGVLELVSKTPYAINTFNTEKLDNIADYLRAALVRSDQEYNNSIKALIQTECTSIHPSVQWKFEKEARRLLRSRATDLEDGFEDIKFQDVYPLYGQIDIIGSSDARNEAVQKDLIHQLDRVYDIFAFAKANEPLPIYDQINHRIQLFQQTLERDGISANTESEIAVILKKEVNPFMKHLKSLSNELERRVTEYEEDLSDTQGVIYSNRDDYDVTVQVVNERTARFLDKKQKEAQQIYPHFFERFKTDGVEHNIYVGDSITNATTFNEVYLYNLRLWQLQTMIEMENKFYQYQEDLPVKVEAASMLLVYGTTLGIRYRIDEKRFDVDGSYNARYEVVKKRIDKAHIAGTKERITQKGKIAIVYTNKDTEREYLRYISFLQNQGYLNDEIELHDLEDVQGVVGLKAIRVGILYNYRSTDDDRITFQDLLSELKS